MKKKFNWIFGCFEDKWLYVDDVHGSAKVSSPICAKENK